MLEMAFWTISCFPAPSSKTGEMGEAAGSLTQHAVARVWHGPCRHNPDFHVARYYRHLQSAAPNDCADAQCESSSRANTTAFEIVW
jgi:hypothetical protein